MEIFTQVKQLGKRGNGIARQPIYLEKIPHTVEQLIEVIVRQQVEQHNNKPDEHALLHFLTQDEIDDQATMGKVGFGVDYNTKRAHPDKAVANALQSFEDGIFKLFVGETECLTLGQNLDLKEGDTLTFIRLTMLSGRLW